MLVVMNGIFISQNTSNATTFTNPISSVCLVLDDVTGILKYAYPVYKSWLIVKGFLIVNSFK